MVRGFSVKSGKVEAMRHLHFLTYQGAWGGRGGEEVQGIFDTRGRRVTYMPASHEHAWV